MHEGDPALEYKKNQEYYNELEIKMEDLDQIEARILEMERYLGIENQTDIAYFLKNDIEKLDQKCLRLDDFVKVIEDKNFILNELHSKYEQLENFLKNGNKYANQCIDLSKKCAMVAESEEHLKQFIKELKEMQQLETYLSFQPVLGKYFIPFGFY